MVDDGTLIKIGTIGTGIGCQYVYVSYESDSMYHTPYGSFHTIEAAQNCYKSKHYDFFPYASSLYSCKSFDVKSLYPVEDPSLYTNQYTKNHQLPHNQKKNREARKARKVNRQNRKKNKER